MLSPKTSTFLLSIVLQVNNSTKPSSKLGDVKLFENPVKWGKIQIVGPIFDMVNAIMSKLIDIVFQIPVIETDGLTGPPVGLGSGPTNWVELVFEGGFLGITIDAAHGAIWLPAGGFVTAAAVVVFTLGVGMKGLGQMFKFSDLSSDDTNRLVGFVLLLSWYPLLVGFINLTHASIKVFVGGPFLSQFAAFIVTLTGASIAATIASSGGYLLIMAPLLIIFIIPFGLMAIIMFMRSLVITIYLFAGPLLIGVAYTNLPIVSDYSMKLLKGVIPIVLMPIAYAPVIFMVDVALWDSIFGGGTATGLPTAELTVLIFAMIFIGWFLLFALWLVFKTTSPKSAAVLGGMGRIGAAITLSVATGGASSSALTSLTSGPSAGIAKAAGNKIGAKQGLGKFGKLVPSGGSGSGTLSNFMNSFGGGGNGGGGSAWNFNSRGGDGGFFDFGGGNGGGGGGNGGGEGRGGGGGSNTDTTTESSSGWDRDWADGWDDDGDDDGKRSHSDWRSERRGSNQSDEEDQDRGIPDIEEPQTEVSFGSDEQQEQDEQEAEVGNGGITDIEEPDTNLDISSGGSGGSIGVSSDTPDEGQERDENKDGDKMDENDGNVLTASASDTPPSRPGFDASIEMGGLRDIPEDSSVGELAERIPDANERFNDELNTPKPEDAENDFTPTDENVVRRGIEQTLDNIRDDDILSQVYSRMSHIQGESDINKDAHGHAHMRRQHPSLMNEMTEIDVTNAKIAPDIVDHEMGHATHMNMGYTPNISRTGGEGGFQIYDSPTSGVTLDDTPHVLGALLQHETEEMAPLPDGENLDGVMKEVEPGESKKARVDGETVEIGKKPKKPDNIAEKLDQDVEGSPKERYRKYIAESNRSFLKTQGFKDRFGQEGAETMVTRPYQMSDGAEFVAETHEAMQSGDESSVKRLATHHPEMVNAYTSVFNVPDETQNAIDDVKQRNT